ncbi:hypothetical protein LJ707_12205 [Mucilaginibacter sp. UR6-1]|uniref:hypothetical protein n=1 Tax=Mucilaginibacter sp. UR6-1 TaxID=1435643 RepID=UPI001E32EF86|nr:hypothetical protein [Mucilaginibacter sp. UR6-1]MCC8409693.1 hypothetical protein [Mucilaginibacter sp. UR6-1]
MLLFLLLTATGAYAQNSAKSFKAPMRDTAIKSNPVIFFNTLFGAGNHGLNLGAELNYQYNQHIFTIKALHATQGEHLYTTPPVTYSPDYDEFGILYGQSINNMSASIGTSFNKRNQLSYTSQDAINHNSRYIGFPWEININWFRKKKARYSIGGAVGLKLFGNISKYSHVGLGATLGLGYYKRHAD